MTQLDLADQIDAALCAFAAPSSEADFSQTELRQAAVLFVPSTAKDALLEPRVRCRVRADLYFQLHETLAADLLPADERLIPDPLPWQFDQPLRAYLQAPPTLALRDDPRPRLLHILHDWGGGTEQFALDYARFDTRYRHLWLQPKNVPHTQHCGSEIRIFDPLSGRRNADNQRHSDQALSAQVLFPPIAITELTHAGYQAFLLDSIERFRISAIFVSSLIGHSLDALRTALPAVLMVHDFFPLWPRLHVDFGDSKLAFDEAQLRSDASHSEPFAAQSTAAWKRLREHYSDAVKTSAIRVICPSEFVRSVLKRVAPDWADIPQQVIAHGIAPFSDATLPTRSNAQVAERAVAQANAQIAQSAVAQANAQVAQRAVVPANVGSDRLRVLVPGRIQGGKGDDLLRQVWPKLSQFCELYLLGPGNSGQHWLGHSHVHLVSDYQRNQLPARLEQINADVALLPRTVAETFSFSLSELLALKQRCVASNSGALPERIVHDVTGWLFDATQPDCLVELLRDLHHNRERLALISGNLADQSPPPEVADQAARYAEVIDTASLTSLTSLTSPAKTAPTESRISLSSARLDQAYQRHWRYRSERLAEGNKALQAQVIERGVWGQTLNRTLSTREHWIADLQTEVRRASETAQQTQTRHQQELDHLHGRLADLGQVSDQHEREAHQRGAHIQQLDQVIESLHQDNSTLHQNREQLARRVDEFINSSSWKLTRPLRVMSRLIRFLSVSLRFQIARVISAMRRTRQSLSARGLRATLAVIKRKLLGSEHSLLQSMPLELPEVPEQFSSFSLDGYHDQNSPAAVDVSIVIPVYNKFHYTETCLRSLKAVDPGLSAEIIVVDDCSSDETPQRLAQIVGIIFVRNANNLGFIGACNAGAAAARGEFVLFLNNDTAVQSGWLTALIAVFRSRADAGLVGAKLVYPDGRLQESGGIIFRDGSGWNYGRFADPQDPAYNFVREVDYCSGAAIMLRRTLFEAFGGFDTLYTPAYYEDTDLAFKVRSKGLKCYVAPRSVVVHFEGVSSGTDLTQGIKRYQVINQEKFLARWTEILKTYPLAPPDRPIYSSAQHRVRKHVLIIDAVTPMPDQDSGSVRMVNLIKILLQQGCAVWFFCEGRHHHQGYAEALQDLGVQVLFAPYLKQEMQFFQEYGAIFDAVMLSRHYVAGPLLPMVREYCKRARVIFDTVDLHFLREQRQAELSHDTALSKLAKQTKTIELNLMRACDLTLVVSPIEQSLLKDLIPNVSVDIVSNIHELGECKNGFDVRSGALFVGGFQHPPNVDAMLWFGREILPVIVAEIPEFVCHVVGSKTPPEIAALAGPNLLVHGFVEDLSDLFANSRISLAPLRYGAGVKGKINSAMAHGLPVIATQAAVEGMYCQDGVDVLIGESAQAFATACLRAYRDPLLWHQLSAGGRENLQTYFSFEAATLAVKRVFALT